MIETHSEYLIRKLQLHVAKKEIKSDDVIIHYFNSDEYVDVNNPKVKPIEIDKDGQLTEMFGPGFFDEATNMKYELIVQNAKSKQKWNWGIFRLFVFIKFFQKYWCRCEWWNYIPEASIVVRTILFEYTEKIVRITNISNDEYEILKQNPLYEQCLDLVNLMCWWYWRWY